MQPDYYTIEKSSTLEVILKVERYVVSLDIPQEEEPTDDVDKDDSKRETKKRNLGGLYGSSLCTSSC